MANDLLPGVHFGHVDEEPTDWRYEDLFDESDELDNDEDEKPSALLIKMLGFDPDELDEG